MTTEKSGEIVGLLLAGGKGTRMGGQDKGLLTWKGEPMAERVYRALSTVVSPVLISANRSLVFYEKIAPGHVYPDTPDNTHNGPLAGLLRGLIEAEGLGAQAVLVSPCDTPDITPATLSALVEAWKIQPLRPVVAECEGRIHPLHGVYPVSVLIQLSEWLASGNRRVMKFAESVNAVVVDCPEAEAAFQNRNRPEDLAGK
ncbi:molybdenum cofactor guanylyltransferase [Marinobacter salinexigens]|uniref:Molybdenum cofactor guanylyltransferase n=1 Tax=Marinobacter salinexigens TaxID=2919747 RepID=A0A5B0VD38_9GAMM|nr:molybdenum cofactor guanylyltransferase MobA [Marinobacter salinexigens]KAA1172374.1 molybdenum cofactor guanylyltransferase [Marinobacter salinexigens]